MKQYSAHVQYYKNKNLEY